MTFRSQASSVIEAMLHSEFYDAPVRTLVTHANCPDGVASAILVRDAIPGIKVLFMQYQSPELAALPAEPGMIFCDFSPPLSRAQEFVDAGACVLDHHKSAKPVVEMFGDRGIFADEDKEPGVCGAVLAFEHIWKPKHGGTTSVPFAEDFAKLAGIRDTWQRKSPRWEEACIQAEMLRFYENWDMPQTTFVWTSLFAGAFDGWWKDRRDVGRLLFEKHQKTVQRAVKGADRMTVNGWKVCVFEGMGTVSDAAELIGEDVDLVIGFGFENAGGARRVKFSLRSHTDFDCSEMAKTYGGGGHTRAAGFDLAIDPMLAAVADSLGVMPEHYTPHPYELARRLVGAHKWHRG